MSTGLLVLSTILLMFRGCCCGECAGFAGQIFGGVLRGQEKGFEGCGMCRDFAYVRSLRKFVLCTRRAALRLVACPDSEAVSCCRRSPRRRGWRNTSLGKPRTHYDLKWRDSVHTLAVRLGEVMSWSTSSARAYRCAFSALGRRPRPLYLHIYHISSKTLD